MEGLRRMHRVHQVPPFLPRFLDPPHMVNAGDVLDIMLWMKTCMHCCFSVTSESRLCSLLSVMASDLPAWYI